MLRQQLIIILQIKKSLIKITFDLLMHRRETTLEANKLLLYIYSDGTIEKKYITKLIKISELNR